ncbi:unnamed protein product [Urochloa humidicola]
MHRHNHYIAYLRWYLSVTRAFVKPPLPDPTVPIENRPDTDDEADDITDAYDRLTREGTQVERAPVQNYMAQQLGRLANEAGVAMAHTSGGNAGAYLRAFAEARLWGKIACHVAFDVATCTIVSSILKPK